MEISTLCHVGTKAQKTAIKHLIEYGLIECENKQFLAAGYVVSGNLFPVDTGVAIGSVIAPIIANMVLDGLQDHIYEKLHNGRKIVYPLDDVDFADGNLLRYADDILITARSRETAEEIKVWTEDFFRERGLRLSEEKSKIIHISEGFDFVSRHYSKHNNYIYAYPTQRSVDRFKNNISEAVYNHTGSQKSLIKTINRKIDGWCSYHKVEEANDVFRHLDVYIKTILLTKSLSSWRKGE